MEKGCTFTFLRTRLIILGGSSECDAKNDLRWSYIKKFRIIHVELNQYYDLKDTFTRKLLSWLRELSMAKWRK